jgi:hypothetical protein
MASKEKENTYTQAINNNYTNTQDLNNVNVVNPLEM